MDEVNVKYSDNRGVVFQFLTSIILCFQNTTLLKDMRWKNQLTKAISLSLLNFQEIIMEPGTRLNILNFFFLLLSLL